MTDFDPVVAAALDRVLPRPRQADADWDDVLRRAQGFARSERRRRLRTLGVAVVVTLTLVSAAEAGVLGRAARAFIDALSPASPPATQIIARAGHRFDQQLRGMARALPGKVSGSAPVLRLTSARQVTTIATERGRVVWDAAIDRSGQGYCQVAVRRDLSLGGDCQVADARGYAISLATSGDTPGGVIVTGLAPSSVASITITRQTGESREARRRGAFFFATVRGGSPITITLASSDGAVLRRLRFSDPVCTNGVSPKHLPLIAGAGFTYCAEGGVIARFAASAALTPVCPSIGCGIPTIENNQQAGVGPLPGGSLSPAEVLNTIRASLHTALIRSARLGTPPAVAGPGGPWLYVGLRHAYGATGVLGQFYAQLLAGAYATRASRYELRRIGGLVGFAAAAPACQRSPTAARCPTPFGYGRIHLQPGAGIGSTADASSLESDIRLGLATAHLRPVSITLVKPLEGLVPIVVARPTTAHPIDVAQQWQTIFGAAGGQAGYLEIVDDHGHPISATARIDILGSGIAWRRGA
jgi:hypothetical protein